MHRHHLACSQRLGSAARVFGRQIGFGWASSKLNGLSFRPKRKSNRGETKRETDKLRIAGPLQATRNYYIPPEGKIRRGSLYYIKMLTVGTWQDGLCEITVFKPVLKASGSLPLE